MVLPPQFDQPPGEFAKRIDSAIDVGQNSFSSTNNATVAGWDGDLFQ